MSQKPIDLLPESIRANCLAGIRTTRLIAAIGIAMVIVVMAATHTRFDLNRARERLAAAEAHARLVLAADAKSREIQSKLSEVRDQIETHDEIILPIDLSALLATLVNQLPPSISFDRLDLTTKVSRPGAASTARGQAPKEPSPLSRLLIGEMTGFGANDDDIAEFVARLENTAPFEGVSLDYSRTRNVRGHGAREFRVSFRIDLDVRYDAAGSGKQASASVKDS